ncbi:MAG: hypothetical protein II887_05235 [Bacteroidales bacterium]|nr:hypothetical protein [Bacteroidales bacterium]
MKRYMSFFVLIILLSSCHRNDDPFFGRWTVDRVNVEFDEYKATPEMVRQYGELEKGNVIEISNDSVLTFISDGDTLKGQCSLRGQQLLLDGKAFGKIEDGLLTTETSTPLGKVRVVYRRSEGH